MKQNMNPNDNPKFYELNGDDRQQYQLVLETIIRNRKVYYLVPEPTKITTQIPELVRRRD